MITKDEILRVADEAGLRPPVVEKDYVLGWLLAAFNAHTAFSNIWVFKGGTCLKKCYFETYRFSEDLDFTLQDQSHLDETFLKNEFAVIAEWLYEASGIEIPVERLRFDIYDNPRGNKSCEGRVYYQSYFSGGKQNLPKIKLDLTADEILVLPPSCQNVSHGYSDQPDEGIAIDCYDYPEVFGEKIRALGERGMRIPGHSGHRFHGKTATDSTAKAATDSMGRRPLIPGEGGHLIPREDGHSNRSNRGRRITTR